MFQVKNDQILGNKEVYLNKTFEIAELKGLMKLQMRSCWIYIYIFKQSFKFSIHCPKGIQQVEKFSFRKIYSILLWTVRVWGIWVLTCSLARPVIPSALCYESSILVMCHQEERQGLLLPQLLAFHLRKSRLPAFLILFPLSLMLGAVFLVDAAERSESLLPPRSYS